ncbi:uncharacterized protein PV06_11247 [Exophiala oligosperma]|uniref:Uncharacterized protein n=1 Tax=Exophiala oligosperma TaxID=215243 RepID=A0A0D2CZX1_9EURO|nr:uncharacterized protein PV06_11247 [Exophiala oligosperma]KIW36538.1 hypothetical protein PV06_11247 [Exophiala oligosperma]
MSGIEYFPAFAVAQHGYTVYLTIFDRNSCRQPEQVTVNFFSGVEDYTFVSRYSSSVSFALRAPVGVITITFYTRGEPLKFLQPSIYHTFAVVPVYIKCYSAIIAPLCYHQQLIAEELARLSGRQLARRQGNLVGEPRLHR